MKPDLRWLRLILALLLLGTTLAAAQEADAELTPYQILDQAKADAGSIPAQALALVRHAWPDEPGDSEVMALARQQLVEYGADAISALRVALVEVDVRYQADVVSTLIHARDLAGGRPPEYLSTLEDAIWFGSCEAKRLAIPLVASQRYVPAMLTLMDAAYECPPLTEMVIRWLGNYSNDRTRHFMYRVLHEGSTRERLTAARGLARTGGRSLLALRRGALSEDPEARMAAMSALFPIAGIRDLSLLHEYVRLYSDDETELVELIKNRARQLELLVEIQTENESATALE